MAVREVRASGLEYRSLATQLLHRIRLADPLAGLWEAADLQWWWRQPRRSDEVDQLFWVDDGGPVAALILTDWGRVWGCDPLTTGSTPVVSPEGLARLTRRGARRLKVGYDTDIARALYVGAGFRVTASCTTYRGERPLS